MGTKKKENKQGNEIYFDKMKSLISKNLERKNKLEYSIEEGTIVINVKPLISFTDRVKLIKEIASNAFIEESNNSVTQYSPEFITFLKRYYILSYYTDIKLPENINDAWLILRYTDIFDDVKKIIGEDIVKEIFDEVDDIINVRKKIVVASNSYLNLFMQISAIINQLTTGISKEDIEKTLSQIENLPNANEIKGLIDKIVSGGNT